MNMDRNDIDESACSNSGSCFYLVALGFRERGEWRVVPFHQSRIPKNSPTPGTAMMEREREHARDHIEQLLLLWRARIQN